MTSRTMGEINTEVQELRRENFNLKLRILFLEEQSDRHDLNILSPTCHVSSSTKTSDNQTTVDNEELRELKAALAICNEENIKLRRTLDDTNNKVPTPSSFSHIRSTTPVNISTVQFDERERQLQNEIDSLKKKLKQINEEHQAELKKYDEHKTRADNTLRRLKDDFDKQVANIHKHRSCSSSNYDTYQHEQLQKECEALRCTEQHLRTQIANLNDLLGRFQSHDQSLIRTSSISVVSYDPKPEDSITVVNHTTEQLRHDTENISHISNHITELVQKYDDCQKKLLEKDAEICERRKEPRNIRELKSIIENKEEKLQRYSVRIEQLQDDLQRVLEEQNRCKHELTNTREQYESQQRRFNELQNAYNKLRENSKERKEHYNEKIQHSGSGGPRKF
ncbi:hypothetical protein I4U23_005143 [Adineta vaga]|nr:hypothetical protein I4U23_005143 [Adineta vaga]